MSRSRRKTPVIAITSARSEKVDKMLANRSLRQHAKEALRRGREVLPIMREISEIWMFDKDGKYRFDPQKDPKLMRK